MPRYLYWLAVGAFAIGTEGYMIAGLLPAMAGDLSVSVAMTGLSVTVFSLGYALGSPVMAVLTGRIERKRLLIGALSAFALFNLAAAAAPSFPALIGVRLLLALAAGTFMPAASALAAHSVPPERRGRALALIFSGLTLAMVIGVPAGALLGGRFGWRTTFGAVALLAAFAVIGIAASLPRVSAADTPSLRDRLAVARRPEVLGLLLVTLVVLMGAFTIYTYLAPFLRRAAGFGDDAIAATLFLFGLAGAAGNLLGGHAADHWDLLRWHRRVIALLIAIFVALSVVAAEAPPALAVPLLLVLIALWGVFGWSFPAVQQMRLVRLDPRLATITLSLNASAIYLGVSAGATLGAGAIAADAPLALGWVGALAEAIALTLLLLPARRRQGAAVPAE